MGLLLARAETPCHEHKNTLRVGRRHGSTPNQRPMGLTCALLCRMDPPDTPEKRAPIRNSRPVPSPGAASTVCEYRIPRVVRARVRKSRPVARAGEARRSSPRDRHAASWPPRRIASSIETSRPKYAHMQTYPKSLEGRSFFSAGQKGSSAMPH